MSATFTWDVFSTFDGHGSYTVWPRPTRSTTGTAHADACDGDVLQRPLRSLASLTLNRALMAAGLVDRLEVTIFPVISGRTETSPILRGAGDFDLELLESRTLDGHTQLLVDHPRPR